MSKRFYEMAKKNYPTLWNREMLDNFYALGRLTTEEYDDIVGVDEDESEEPEEEPEDE